MKNPNNIDQSKKGRGELAIVLSACLLVACSSSSNDSPATTSTVVTVGDSSGETVGGTTAGNTSAGATAGGSSDTSSTGSTNNTDTGDGGTADGSSEGSADAGLTDGTAAPIDPSPIVRAPADEQILFSDTLVLAGSVTFTGVPLDIPVIKWVKLSGPGNAVFGDSSSANTTVTFDQAGTYLLEISASNGPHISADQMQVVVTTVVMNQAPSVDAGADESLTIDEVLNLSANVDDDGLPTGNLSGLWSKVSGPGDVTFGELSDVNTTASFSTTGEYVLRFTATDGELSAGDNLSVQVNDVVTVPSSQNNVDASNNWRNVNTGNGTNPQERHEAAAVAYQGKLYLMGGRGIRQVNRYDPTSNSWENLGSPSFELSHFQPVVYGGKIYVVGSLDCCFPSETVIPKIQIFNPVNKKWTTGASMPQNRRRGSAGVVVHNNKIYIVGGSTNGHDGGMVNWFDEYNPANNQWKTLPNAPSKRDHFSAAVVGNKLVAAGGRQTDHPATFQNLVPGVDVYNFSTGKWSSGANIPTKRAGAMTVSVGDEVILMGGEKDSGIAALSVVEAYNVKTNKWRTLDSLNIARHSGGAAVVSGAIHVVSGNLTTGGGAETQAHEKLNID